VSEGAIALSNVPVERNGLRADSRAQCKREGLGQQLTMRIACQSRANAAIYRSTA